jgi:hypothetical protein
VYDVFHNGERYQSRRNINSDVLAQLKLVDMKTLEMVPAVKDGQLAAYTFTLDGGETSRQFRWVLGPLKGKYFEPGEGAMRYLAQQRKALRAQAGNSSDKLAGQGKSASKPHPVFGLPPGQ